MVQHRQNEPHKQRESSREKEGEDMNQMLKPSETRNKAVLFHHSPHNSIRAKTQAGQPFFALFHHSPACTQCHVRASDYNIMDSPPALNDESAGLFYNIYVITPCANYNYAR